MKQVNSEFSLIIILLVILVLWYFFCNYNKNSKENMAGFGVISGLTYYNQPECAGNMYGNMYEGEVSGSAYGHRTMF